MQTEAQFYNSWLANADDHVDDVVLGWRNCQAAPNVLHSLISIVSVDTRSAESRDSHSIYAYALCALCAWTLSAAVWISHRLSQNKKKEKEKQKQLKEPHSWLLLWCFARFIVGAFPFSQQFLWWPAQKSIRHVKYILAGSQYTNSQLPNWLPRRLTAILGLLSVVGSSVSQFSDLSSWQYVPLHEWKQWMSSSASAFAIFAGCVLFNQIIKHAASLVVCVCGLRGVSNCQVSHRQQHTSSSSSAARLGLTRKRSACRVDCTLSALNW